MNPTELKDLANTLNGIADGKPWQFEGQETWIDAREETDPTVTYRLGYKIRLKPWELTGTVNGHTLPLGSKWFTRHAMPWTEEMLPAPYRPMMDLEVIQHGDQYTRDGKEWETHQKPASEYSAEGYQIGSDMGWLLHRTTRPIPFTLTPEKIADGWVLWNGGECPVEPKSRPTLIFRTGHELPVLSSAKAIAWDHSDSGGDVLAYKPDPYGHLRQALAEGKVIQTNGYGEWSDLLDGSEMDRIPVRNLRIKEPQWLPLGPEDVPPGSEFQRPNYIKTSVSIIGRNPHGFWYRNASGDHCFVSYSDAYEYGGQINRSLAAGKWDPTLWEPCRKRSTV